MITIIYGHMNQNLHFFMLFKFIIMRPFKQLRTNHVVSFKIHYELKSDAQISIAKNEFGNIFEGRCSLGLS